MFCSECGAFLPGGSCPSCNSESGPGQRRRAEDAERVTPVGELGDASQRETAARWQQELKRRLASRTVAAAAADPARVSRELSAQDSESAPESAPESDPESDTESAAATPFRYRMKAADAPYPRPVPSGKPTLASRRLVRQPATAQEAEDAAQRQLPLESRGLNSDLDEEALAGGASDPVVNREILFSRFLCGIIDLSLPVLTGFLFTVGGSWILNFDFFLSAALEWAGAFSLFFFFFNSFFFLLLMGQTPGMYVTELRLVSDRPGQVTVSQVLLRVLSFLPSALSVAGIAWSLHDPMCRAAHDRVSGTRVEVIEEPVLA